MIHGTYSGQACGPCSESGESPGTGTSLYLGAFPSLANLSTLHPAPQAGSYAQITVANAADDNAYWDISDNAWRVTGSNNRVRLFGVGITNAPYPSDSVINFPESLTVLPDEIVVLSLIRILPPPAGSLNSVHTKERYLWGKGKGSYSPIGNVAIGTDIIYIGNEVISEQDISNIPNTVTRDIGEVPDGQTLEQYINGLGPGDLIDLTDETKTYFLSFQLDGQTRLAAFAGEDSAHGHGWYGSVTFGGLQATPGDFSIIGGSSSGPGPTANLEQVTLAGATTPIPVTIYADDASVQIQPDGFLFTGDNSKTAKLRFNEVPANVQFNLPENKTGQQTLVTLDDIETKVDVKIADYALSVNDTGRIIEINSSTSKTLTIPNNATVPFKVGTQIMVSRVGTGDVEILAGTDVVIRQSLSFFRIKERWDVVTLYKRGTNEWVLIGNLKS